VQATVSLIGFMHRLLRVRVPPLLPALAACATLPVAGSYTIVMTAPYDTPEHVMRESFDAAAESKCPQGYTVTHGPEYDASTMWLVASIAGEIKCDDSQ
jgi:hypothetical protein